MYRAGLLMRRSSVRIKSLSGGHSHLLMIISQIREVRTSFKSFLAAQSILSDDLSKWSSSVDNEAIHETFSYLAQLSSLWTEVQRDFVDNLKHFRSNFDMILEGEKHVDQAKQTYATREEAERDGRRELQKAYKKSSADEIQILRERLNKSEKSKESAHLEVVDRIRENEAIRMIRVKEGMKKYGESFLEVIHKANYVFNAQQKVVAELPDVHDKALHGMKYRGHICTEFVQEAKEQTRLYRRPSASSDGVESKSDFFDPPPPYTPSSDNMNALTGHLSSTSLNAGEATQDCRSPSAPIPLDSSTRTLYPTLESPPQPLIDIPTTSNLGAVSSHSDENCIATNHPRNPPDTKPILLPLKATRLKRRKSRHSSSPVGRITAAGAAAAALDSPSNGEPEIPSVDTASMPPPYNPFYEWSSFQSPSD